MWLWSSLALAADPALAGTAFGTPFLAKSAVVLFNDAGENKLLVSEGAEATCSARGTVHPAGARWMELWVPKAVQAAAPPGSPGIGGTLFRNTGFAQEDQVRFDGGTVAVTAISADSASLVLALTGGRDKVDGTITVPRCPMTPKP